MLTRLLYASRSVGPIDGAFLESIFERSRSNNLEHGITGVLCVYDGGNVFLQALEGSRAEVNSLYCAIVRDPQVAEALEVKLNTVYSRLRLGRAALSRALNPPEVEPP